MYKIIPQSVAQSQRAEINERILSAIRGKTKEIPPETVYNTYSGLGGLHNLKQADFENYYEYSQAKKEFEIGQFFTPHAVCQQMAELIEPNDNETVLDMCCGMGNFFNHLPNQHNAYGFDIDKNAVAVAEYLYPKANIEQCDIRQYNPTQKFDIIIGNPPFNLDFDGVLSQFYYCQKAVKLLKPAGLMLIITPCSFLQSDFWDKTQVSAIKRDFSFIGQMKLPGNAFSCVGVENFETKIMAFSLNSAHIQNNTYLPDEFVEYDELKERITAFKELKNSLKH